MRRFVQTGTADTPSFEDVAALLIGTDHPRPFLAIPAVSSSSSRFDSFIRARSSIAGWKEAPVVRRCRLLGSFAPATIEFMNGIGGDNGSRTNRPPEGRLSPWVIRLPGCSCERPPAHNAVRAIARRAIHYGRARPRRRMASASRRRLIGAPGRPHTSTAPDENRCLPVSGDAARRLRPEAARLPAAVLYLPATSARPRGLATEEGLSPRAMEGDVTEEPATVDPNDATYGSSFRLRKLTSAVAARRSARRSICLQFYLE